MKNGLIIHHTGAKHFYLNDQLHREDGPAIETPKGTKIWAQYDKYHRLDGPAVEYGNGKKEFWFRGEVTLCKTQKEFDRWVRLRMFR